MDKSFVKEMQVKLEEMKHQLEEELGGFTRRDPKVETNFDTEFPEFGDKEDDNATEVATFTDNLAVEHTLGSTLEDVTKALERITKGNYGVCRYCGEEIPEGRLRARPESSSCVKCKTERLQRA